MAEDRNPQHIKETDWYYEMPSHLLLVHEVKTGTGAHIQTDQIKIPWRMIEQSRKRRQKQRSRKR